MNQGLSYLLSFAFNRIVKLDFLAGYRMYFGGFLSILGGVALVLEMVIAQEFSEPKAGAAWAAFALGFTVIGSAGKQDKVAEETVIAAEKVAIATEAAAVDVATAVTDAAAEADRKVND